MRPFLIIEVGRRPLKDETKAAQSLRNCLKMKNWEHGLNGSEGFTQINPGISVQSVSSVFRSRKFKQLLRKPTGKI